MKFSATFSDASKLLKTFAVLNDLTGELCLSFTEKGVSVNCMDSSHVCLVNVEWTTFSRYACSQECVVGVHVGNLVRMLRCHANADSVTMQMEDDTADMISVVFASEARVAHFELKTLDLESEEMGVPESEPDAVIDLDSREFQTIVKDLATISDTVLMRVSPHDVAFEASGDIGRASIKLANAAERATISQEFSVRYLATFAKMTDVFNRATINMSDEMPLVLRFQDDACRTTFFLAPKISGDMDC
jgi:proliferating cell nuclear antigen